MKRKFFYLFLALALPGLIFVFLKKFGRNEFAIPIYYQQSADSINAVCGTRYAQPFRIPDTVLEKTGWKAGPASLFILEGQLRDKVEMMRFTESFSREEFQIVEVDKEKYGEVVFNRWSSCVFMIKPPANAVLVDGQKQIRGHYSLGSLEEGDRLIMETQILLKKY